VTTKDVIYFIVIVYIFLGLSICKLKDGMESKPTMVKVGRYATIVVSALLIGYFSSLPGMIGYYDATANKSRTLTPKAQNIIKELGDEPLEITTYNNLVGNYWFLGGPDSYNQTLARWEPYMRFKSNIALRTVSYYDSAFDNPYLFRGYPDKNLKEIAEQYAKNNDVKLKDILTPEQIHKIIDLKPEMNRFVMQLKWKGRTTFLRVFNDQIMWPGETEVSAAFKRLQQAKLPKIVFLTGDLERDINKIGDKEYKTLTNQSTFRNSLINQGFDVDTVSLETREIPANIAALVVADPKIAFTPVTLAKLQRYINDGGNLLIAGEPGKQAILNPLLKQLGVQLMNGILIQESKDLAPNLVAPDLTKMAGTFSKPLAEKAKDSVKISMPGAVGLSYTADGAFTIEPLLMTDAKLTWNRIKPLDLEMMTNASAGSSGVTMMASGGAAVAMSATVDAGPAKVEKSSASTTVVAGNTPAMEERKQKAAATQKAITEIMSGPGTQEEKQQKMKELMAKARAEAEAAMTPEMKKTRDSIRTALTAIMNGTGTPEEKQKKAGELMAKANKHQAPVQITKAAPRKVTPDAGNADAASASGGMVMAMPAGSSSSIGDGRRSAAAGTVSFSAAEGDVRGPIPTALSLTRKVNGKEQRIVVAGDADFMSNSELQRFNLRTANFVFNTALFSWLSYGEFPIDTSRPEAKDKRVTVTMDQVDFLRIIYVWILPALLLAFGAILLIRRKRK
jgi:ABC-2 type transport system permease protein